jgi:hypothetical protein
LFLILAIVSAALLATGWAVGFVWAAIRVKGIWERLLCAVLSIPGFLAMLVTYGVLAFFVAHGPGILGGFGTEPPRVQPAGAVWVSLAVAADVSMAVAIRGIWAKGHSSA